MEHCFSYFTQAYHNSWIKYDNFDSIHCCGFIRNRKRDWGTKSSLFLHKPLFLKISFYLNRTATCVPPFLCFLPLAVTPAIMFTLFFNDCILKQLGWHEARRAEYPVWKLALTRHQKTLKAMPVSENKKLKQRTWLKNVSNAIIKEKLFFPGSIISYNEGNLNYFHHFPNQIAVPNSAGSFYHSLSVHSLKRKAWGKSNTGGFQIISIYQIILQISCLKAVLLHFPNSMMSICRDLHRPRKIMTHTHTNPTLLPHILALLFSPVPRKRL